MKRNIHFFTFFSLLFLFVTTTKIGAHTTPEKNLYSSTVLSSVDMNNPLGVWTYTIVGSKSEYKEGTLFVRKEKDVYIVEVQLENGTITGQDVQVEKNSIKFYLNIEGIERVAMVLSVEGNAIKGKTYSDQGTYEVQGARKLPPE